MTAKITALLIVLTIHSWAENPKPEEDDVWEREAKRLTKGKAATGQGKEKRQQEERALIKKCSEIARREWPEDGGMQIYTYKNQLVAGRYMIRVTDPEVKAYALREWPEDFSMQKYTYDKQLVAKRYMSKVTNKRAKTIAIIEWRGDYSMQKYTYNRLISSKR